ncbi:hypothetical protein K438DRAFT_618872 [Mycena galopus ATCC 62051]|nr:hypothetical protein K438DRAFT_618872 [Mycena galopus ATCC 62051]
MESLRYESVSSMPSSLIFFVILSATPRSTHSQTSLFATPCCSHWRQLRCRCCGTFCDAMSRRFSRMPCTKSCPSGFTKTTQSLNFSTQPTLTTIFLSMTGTTGTYWGRISLLRFTSVTSTHRLTDPTRSPPISCRTWRIIIQPSPLRIPTMGWVSSTPLRVLTVLAIAAMCHASTLTATILSPSPLPSVTAVSSHLWNECTESEIAPDF